MGSRRGGFGLQCNSGLKIVMELASTESASLVFELWLLLFPPPGDCQLFLL
jgi:hypothetical protein